MKVLMFHFVKRLRLWHNFNYRREREREREELCRIREVRSFGEIALLIAMAVHYKRILQ
jgi:hypothetical protein